MEAVSEAWKTTFHVCSFHNVDIWELVDEHELICGETWLDSVDLLLADSAYNIRSGRTDDNSHYNVLFLEGMADAAAFCKSLMRSSVRSDLFCPT